MSLKIKQHRRDCVWLGCTGHKGGSRNSKEHVFSEWMHDLIEHPQLNWHIQQLGVAGRQQENRRRPGLTIHRTINVCKNCNETWMRDIEDETKSTLTPLIQGEAVEVSPERQLLLAKWLTLKAIVAEFDDRRAIAIPPAERSAFFQSPAPRPDWQIFIGHYEGEDWKSRYHHHPFYLSEAGIHLPRGVQIHNAQMTILSYGSLFAFSVSNMRADAFGLPIGYFDLMDRIWPNSGNPIHFRKATISDRDADEIMNFVPNMVRQIAAG